MKKFNLVLAVAASMFAATVFAQNTTNKWYIGVGMHAVDHTSARGVFDGFFDTKDYSIVPPLSKLTVARSIAKNFAVDLQASIGNVDNNRLGGSTPESGLAFKDEFFILAGLGLRWTPLSETSWFDPYLRVGANYHKYAYDGYEISETNPKYSWDHGATKGGTAGANGALLEAKFSGQNNNFIVNGGVGINFWFTKNFGLNIESQYNWAPGATRDYIDFFQHSASIIFKFGNSDRDKDGILDKDDKCPDVWGLAQFQGCPDTDGDGITDAEDQCPTVAGPIENHGCPWGDRDNDGVTDNIDKCPDVAGPAENQGCPWPDRDGDGVLDKDDRCPDTPGLAKFKGCPDTDGDGIPDPDDKCPNEAGPIENHGCPVTYKTVTEALQDITFEFNSAKLTAESLDKVKTAASFLNSSSLAGQNAYVDGYTDKSGSAAYNLKLSKQRAQSVTDALVENGVAKDRLTARGFGKTNFLCTDADVKAGKYTEDVCNQINRRVEVAPRTLTVQKTVEVKSSKKK
ncbi:MAG: OmpA family protein [Flavobacteriaceae bacterium]|jgi:outer membrane protein OmpA-like peptidoglycan-associated protein|nr:OmpA family protein [Flavobacteriaceae bacterium]